MVRVLRTLMYGFLYSLLNFLRIIGWWRWSVEGLENLPPRESGGMLIVCNHSHWLDIPVLGSLMPFKYRLSWLAKSELFANPFARWFFTTMDVVPIRRGKRDVAALEQSAEMLRNGSVLLIYPEGHRSGTGVLQEGRGGAIRLAMASQAPLVPVAISGTEHGLKGTLLRKPVVMRIGKPYLVEPTENGKVPPPLMEELTTDMMCRIAEMLPADKRGPYGPKLEERNLPKLSS